MESSSHFVFSKPKLKPITYIDDGQTKAQNLKIQIPNQGKVFESNYGKKALDKKVNNIFPQSIFLVSILEHLCGVYEKDERKANNVFLAICKQLEKVDIISPLAYMEEYASVRHQYKSSFYHLIQSAVNLDSRLQLKYDNHSSEPTPSKYNLISSRFKEEFIELERLGKGAYGCVYKAKHKMDGQLYAMKKIQIKKTSDVEKISRIIREVQSLAALQQHGNIVRYHQAWLEQEFSHLAKQQEFDSTKSNEISIESNKKESNCSHNSNVVENNSNDSFLTNSFEVAPYSNLSRVGKFWRSNSSPSLSNYSNYSNRRNGFMHGDSYFSTATNSTGSFFSGPHKNGRDKIHNPQNCSFVLYIQMELCEKTLSNWLITRNQELAAQDKAIAIDAGVDVEIALSIFKQIVAALNHLHQENIFHRDVKPSNIFVCGEKSPHVLLGDFGLARAMNSKFEPLTPHPGLSDDSGEYTTGVGTTVYAAPEQLEGQDYCYKADMFSVGIVLFELMCPLYTSHERGEVIKSLRKGVIAHEFSESWPEISILLSTLISHNPDDRPTASEVLKHNLFWSENEKIINDQRNQISVLKTENIELKTKNLELENLVKVLQQKLEAKNVVLI